MPAARAKPARTQLIASAVVAAILAAALWPFLPRIAAGVSGINLRAPNLALWGDLPWMVQLHVYAAVTALVIGTVILLRPKGRGLHKALGWSWVLAMGVTAVSSLFITGLNGGYWSFIHLLSGWTIIALPMAIYAIRSRKVDIHRRAMTSMFVGGLLVAGALSFIPGRVMFQMFFG
ncbi:MAG TPA: DUF2306 domain-containing protein [Vitreimonas sp.]|uniref:DUF2306 domain-containing protein n=1 Tax=Vitreimonas sp. TaxID=3069702 RepID=UPI002D4B59F5|nr:DUF2306 domain-containing protein [Vitreimonas sp.]HYD89655.1 DUF2306 domain-containing protein [Vitreimonas sp.]